MQRENTTDVIASSHSDDGGSGGSPPPPPTGLELALESLSLEVKAYVQPLGVENAWSDLGEGFVEIEGSTIRVRPAASAPMEPEDCDGDEETAKRLTEAMQATNDEPLLEDELDCDTQCIGKDSCIVWNSPAQELSFCIMFTTDMGYDATYAAFQYVVSREMTGWTVDLFAATREAANTPASFAADLAERDFNVFIRSRIENIATPVRELASDDPLVPVLGD